MAPQPFYSDRGTPIAVRQVLLALSELGYRVDVLTFPVGESPPIPNVEYHRTPGLPRIKSVPVGLSATKIGLDVLMMRPLFRRICTGNYYCVHAVEEAVFPATFFGRRCGVPVIYDMQSSLPEQLSSHPLFGAAPIQSVLNRMEARVLQAVDLVVSSAGLADRVRASAPKTPVREWSFVPAEHYVSWNLIEQTRRELEIGPDQRVVAYTGTFEPYQGLDILLEALTAVLAHNPAVVVLLVGGNSEQTEEVRRSAERLGIRRALRLLPRQEQSRIPAYLGLADVLVSPRQYGGNLPLKIFDYLAAGRPIVATDIPTHRSILGEEFAVLVPPTAAGLARGISAVLDDPAAAARLAAAAKDHAERSYSWEAFVRTVGDAYASIQSAGAGKNYD